MGLEASKVEAERLLSEAKAHLQRPCYTGVPATLLHRRY